MLDIHDESDESDESDRIHKTSRSRKYCHVHKSNDEDANAAQILGEKAFSSLSSENKRRHVLYSHIKQTNADHIKLIRDSRENRAYENLKSISYHGTLIGNITPDLLKDIEDLLNTSIGNYLPNNLEEIEAILNSSVPESGKIFCKSHKYFEEVESVTSMDWIKDGHQYVCNELASQYPKTFSTFKAPIPNTKSLNEFISILQGKDYLDNEKNSCTHYHLLINTLNISEDLLIEIEKINALKKQRASKVQKILELYDQGLNVSDIKKNLDSFGQNTGRPYITKIINAHTKKGL
ncbi:MAG: hypothetical protein ACTH58_15700 [Marinomonas foliarum]|uniref:hypothetical protein n=1 Tax=Marinomonas foliarum TaxID=491950 RepID=UPI003F99BE2F